jgi:hypothetical protein
MAKPNYAFEKRQKELAKKKKKEEKRLRKAEEGHIEEEGGTIPADADIQPATDSST